MITFLKCMVLAYLTFTFISFDPLYFIEGTDQRFGFLVTSVAFYGVHSFCNFPVWRW